MKIFISHTQAEAELAAGLAHALREEGHEILDAAAAAPFAADLVSEVSSAIRGADVVVAIVTVSSPRSFFEIGASWGAGIPMLVAAPAGEPLPVDLASFPYVRLSGDPSRDIREMSRRAVELAKPPHERAPSFESARAALSAAARDSATLESLNATQFEELVKRLLQETGVKVISNPTQSDWGADFMIESGDECIAVEVKKLSRQSRVPVHTVRSFLGTMVASDASTGMIVSSAGFTAAAYALAQTTRVALMTLEDLLADGSALKLPGGGAG